jgi:sugar transferase (PEP-CTERM/EpsH1 system associated)
MEILWLKSELLHPVDKGGKIRTYQMLKHLKRQHRVTYLALTRPDDSAEAYARATEYCHRLVAVPWSEPARFSPGFYRDVARNFVSPLPYAIEKYSSTAMRRAIGAELARHAYDVVVCDFLVPSVNLPDRLPVASVLFQHNVEAMIWRRHAETATGVKRALFQSQWRKMVRYERDACRRFDAVAAVSELDRDTMRDEYGLDRVLDVPTGVDYDYFRPLGGEPSPSEIVFTGSMDWMPNEDGIVWFVENVLPIVAREVPDARLTIVGRNPTPRVSALAEADQRVTVTGRVDDIRPYVDRAAAFVVPLRVGGGTRLKIYEAMAMAKPVVSTAIGAEGLPLENGRDLLVADDPADLAGAVVRVLSDRELAEQIGEQGRALVRDRFGWEHAAEAFAGICSLATKHATLASRARVAAAAAGSIAPAEHATVKGESV